MRSVLWRVETRRAWPPGQGAQRGLGAPQDASCWVGRQRHGAGVAPLAVAPATPAPRSTRPAPLTVNASHLDVRNTR
ncbi:hypothetical protein CKY51_03460 [Xanthomonas maliensis]|nr:hypothetical protein CKY51_03460 [Xanthomonas maliensis]